MNRNKFALGCLAALSLGTSVVTGCAGDRPLRNGVPNENLFLRKSFIIKPGEVDPATGKAKEDNGWMLKATVVETSTPNPLAESVLFTGAENNGMLVRFVATQDKLQLVNQREISSSDAVKEQGTRTPEVVDAWGAEHGDLKLAVTADGEKTNRFEMNQELDWKTRQWVRVNLAKNDLSDFSLFGPGASYFVSKCSKGASTTIVPGSILVDDREGHDYIEWKTSVTLPINTEDKACMESFGESGQNFFRLGRQNVTVIVKYSMMRAVPTEQITYKPLELDEKDPIRKKYGPILQTSWGRDPTTGQLAAREFAIRFDPTKEMTLYFAKGYPEEKKSFFLSPGGIVDQTNAIFEKAGAQIRLTVKNFDEDIPADADNLTKERGREYGDIRYNFIRWMSDLDVGAPFIGVAQFVPDPRTGQALSASINIADFPLKEFVAQRVDAFLSTIMCNASKYDEKLATTVCADLNSDKPWGPPLKSVKGADGKFTLEAYPESCNPGEVAGIIPEVLNASYGKSSLYSKMQEYLGEPAAKYGPLGPRDFVPPQDKDFDAAFSTLLPYYIFADPATNPFVTPVGDGGEFGPASGGDMKGLYDSLGKVAQFHQLTGKINEQAVGDANPMSMTGPWPFDPNGGVEGVSNFLTQFQQGQLDHRDFMYAKQFAHKKTTMMDEASDLISFTGVMEKAGRHCVNGHWETREEWMDKLIQTYHSLTVWHEFGHVLGMDHNFMASVDKANYPRFKAQNCDPATDPQKCDRIGMYSSSVMEYSSTPDRIFWANETGDNGWAPYDRGAIGWLYGNEGTLSQETKARANKEYEALTPEQRSNYISKQLSPTLPYNDPFGFDDGGKEKGFLYCNANHTKFTPFCRQMDFGSSPSEIIANEIEAYEWQYAWRNFRKYRKVWDLHNYADAPSRQIIELRRFLPLWRSDWQAESLRDDFGKLNFKLPTGANANEAYYGQLATRFDDELSQANQMVAAFHLALIQQSSGERPFATIIDKYSGDVTQQGITLDKNFAMTGWVGLWPSDNYDPNQRGNWISSFGSQTDPEYGAIAEKAVASMIGEERFDAFPYLRIAAVVLFARDTHNPNFNGRVSMKDWVGGQLFDRPEDLERYFRDMAIKAQRFPELGCATGPGQITNKPTVQTCTYDPRVPRGRDTNATHLSDSFNEFDGPDGMRWAWAEFKDRRQFLFVQRDRNTATYKLVRDYTENIVKPEIVDERAYTYALPLKYAIDAYKRYENFAPK
jgi:hypothetical protein